MVFGVAAAIFAVAIVIAPLGLGLFIVFAAITPSREATLSTWFAFLCLLSWHLLLAALAVVDVDHRALALTLLLSTVPFLYALGQLARVLYSVWKRGRLPHFGEWFD